MQAAVPANRIPIDLTKMFMRIGCNPKLVSHRVVRKREDAILPVAVDDLHAEGQQLAAIDWAIIRQVHFTGIFAVIETNFEAQQFVVAAREKPFSEKRPQPRVEDFGFNAERRQAGDRLAIGGRRIERFVPAMVEFAETLFSLSQEMLIEVERRHQTAARFRQLESAGLLALQRLQ